MSCMVVVTTTLAAFGSTRSKRRVSSTISFSLSSRVCFNAKMASTATRPLSRARPTIQNNIDEQKRMRYHDEETYVVMVLSVHSPVPSTLHAKPPPQRRTPVSRALLVHVVTDMHSTVERSSSRDHLWLRLRNVRSVCQEQGVADDTIACISAAISTSEQRETYSRDTQAWNELLQHTPKSFAPFSIRQSKAYAFARVI